MFLEKISLTPPHLDHSIGAIAAIRPYRKGGLRIEQQIIQDKYIIHNYGHGGGGVSLAYGSSYVASEIIKGKHGYSPKQIAVLGAGFMGLFTALCLRQQGHKVTIYTDKIPQKKAYQLDQPITSQTAGGYWMPYGLDKKDQVDHQILTRLSFEFYCDCIRQGRYKGLSFMPVYHLDSIDFIKNYVPSGLIKDIKPVLIQFGNGKYFQGHRFTSLLIECDIFLRQLYEEVQHRFVNVEIRKFNTLDDVIKLKQNYIFNCTGFSSKYLFNDQNMVGIKGHIVYFKRTPGVNYYLSAVHNGQRLTIYPHSDKTGVGISKQQGKEDTIKSEKIMNKITERAIDFFKDKTVTSKL